MKKLTSRDYRFLVIFGAFALLGIVTLVAANYQVIQNIGRGGDLLLPWKAARTFFFEGGEPYSGVPANFVQQKVYGHTPGAGENPYVLDLPFYLLLPYGLLGIFEDPAVARAVYLFLSEAGLLALAFFSLRLTDWQPRRLFVILFFLFCGLGLYSLMALVEGTPAILLGLIFAGILLTLRADRDELAGALLAFAFSRWEIGGLFIALVLLRVVAQRRWRVFFGLFMSTFFLAVISFLLYPGWPFPFAVGLLANWTADYGVSAGAVFIRLWPEIGSRLGWALTGLSVLILGFEWARAREADFRRFYWAACLTLSLTPLAGFRTQTDNLVVLIIPLAFIFAIARERWKAGYWLSVSLLAIILAVPWALVLGGFVPAQLRDDLLFLFLPVVTVIGLYWIRWWAIRPPRTWIERVSRPEYR